MFPMPFNGTAREREMNFRTHRWTGGPDSSCLVCDARAGSVTSFWPCGVEPPRAPGHVTVGSCPLLDMMAEADEREPGGI